MPNNASAFQYCEHTFCSVLNNGKKFKLGLGDECS